MPNLVFSVYFLYITYSNHCSCHFLWSKKVILIDSETWRFLHSHYIMRKEMEGQWFNIYPARLCSLGHLMHLWPSHWIFPWVPNTSSEIQVKGPETQILPAFLSSRTSPLCLDYSSGLSWRRFFTPLPPRDIWQFQGHFWLFHLGEGRQLLAFSEPGILLSILQCIG